MTQQQLADHFGIARVSVTQWENNTTAPESDKLPKLAEILGGSVEWYLTGHGAMPISDKLNEWAKEHLGSSVAKPNAVIGEKVASAGGKIPVYGQAVGGQDGEFLMNGNVLFEVMAPPSITPASGAYAISISGESMEPRYFDGEVAFVDPRRRPRKGDFVVAQIQTADDHHGPPLAFVKRFIRHTSDGLVLEQFNPAKELRFPHEHVVSVHYIAMAGNA